MTTVLRTLLIVCFLLLMFSIDVLKEIPPEVTFVSEAEAIIGRPLTPVSFAGVARRTTRRVVVGTTAVVATSTAAATQPTTVVVEQAPAQPSAQATTAVPIGTVVPALPAGCSSVTVQGANYFNCAGVYYKPSFQGNNLIYVVVEKP